MDLEGKRVLVTGGNGFIGSHLVRRLNEQEGARVRALVRRAPTEPAPVEYCYGDVTDAQAVERAADGCDAIIHTAALQSSNPLATRDAFWAANVGGSLNLLRAFRPDDRGSFILLSTINAHGLPPPASANADSPLVYSGDRYSDSKVDGERACREWAKREGVPLTVIRPACTFGPGSRAWTLQPLERIRRGIPVLIGSGRGLCNPVYIDNLVDLIIAAIKNEAAAGEAFIGSDGVGVEWRAFLDSYARLLGRPLRAIPYPAARAAAVISSLLERGTGRPGPLSRASLAFYSHRVIFDVSKNEKILGLSPRISFEEGMQRTLDWLRTDRRV